MSDLLASGVFEACFDFLASRRGLLVGVSGGPDSLALLHLLARWALAPGRPKVFAATVDHALRAGSRDEAEMVGRAAADLGVPHAILTWEGPKPAARLQELARDARYALLEAHAERIDADTLLTAHHADDQAETILFRLSRGSGIAGLAGMARESRRGALFHARPLLGFDKADLVGVCEALGQSFVMDPSNADPRFARTGLRRLARTLEREGFGREALLRLGERAGRADEALAMMAEKLTEALEVRRAPGVFAGDFGALRSAPLEMTVRILSAEVERVSGVRPRLDRAETLAARVRNALIRREGLRATLGGALVGLSGDGHLVMEREAPRQRGSPKLKETETNSGQAVHTIVKKTRSGSRLPSGSLGKGQPEA